MARFGRSFPIRGKLFKRPDLGLVYFDNSSFSAYSAAVSTFNWTHTIGTNSNRLLLVNVSIFATGTVTSIDIGGETLTFIRADTNGVYRNEIWYRVAPTSGIGRTITVNLSAAITSIAGATSYWNANQVIPNANNGANGINTPASASVTPTSSNTRIFGGVTTQTASGVLGGTEQAPRWINQGALGTSAAAEKGTIITAAATTLSWTGMAALDSWAISLVAIEPPRTPISQALTEIITIVDTMSRTVGRVLSETVTIVDTVVKLGGKVLSEIVVIIDSIVTLKTLNITLTEIVTVVDSIVRAIGRLISETITIVDTVAKTVGRVFSEVITVVDSLIKTTGKALSESVTIVDSIVRTIGRSLSEVITVVDTIAKTIGKIFSESVSIRDALTTLYAIGARGLIRGVNRDTNTGIGVNKDTGTGIGTRKT